MCEPQNEWNAKKNLQYKNAEDIENNMCDQHQKNGCCPVPKKMVFQIYFVKTVKKRETWLIQKKTTTKIKSFWSELKH